jgi:cysteine desulfurase
MYTPEGTIYLDNNATTPLHAHVLAQMMPYLTHAYGNPSSTSHAFGWDARAAVELAREKIARAIHAAHATDIVFTSGATESINLALAGFRYPAGRGHVVTTSIEHKAVLDCTAGLAERGRSVTYVAPQADGVITPDAIGQALRDDTGLVSVMTANNEIGTLQDIEAIGSICRARGIVLHTDATQAVGKTAFDVQRMGVGLASFSGHKLYGPKGIGALYVNRRDVTVSPLIVGGGHEQGLRSGTLNVAGIVGFGAAIELAIADLDTEGARQRRLRDALRQSITSTVAGIDINGHPTQCLPGLLHVSIDGIDADSLLLELSDIALSSGSACTSAQRAPSHVLKAIGRSDAQSQGSVRFGLGRFTTDADIGYVGARFAAAVAMLRSMAPRRQASA